MNWEKKISRYINENTREFIEYFFPNSSIEMVSNDFRLNPSPCCGHNDCFTFASDKDAAHCFSCSMSGNKLNVLKDIVGEQTAVDELQKWAGIPNEEEDNLTPEEIHRMRKEREINEIYEIAIDFYSAQLFKSDDIARAALGKQLEKDISKGGRAHTHESLKEHKVGLSLDTFDDLIAMLKHRGYSDEVIREARKIIWVPPFYYVYPYFRDGKLVRINAKSFMRVCLGSKNYDGTKNRDCTHRFVADFKDEIDKHVKETGHVMSGIIFSSGDRWNTFFYKRTSFNPKKLILVEGENDVLSVHEELITIDPEYEKEWLVASVGGKPTKGTFRSRFVRGFEEVYGLFDNDTPGKQMIVALNEEAADVDVFEVPFNKDFKDIDLFLKSTPPEERSVNMYELLTEHAVPLTTDQVIIYKKGGGHNWVAKNRGFEINFNVEGLNKAKLLTGSMIIYVNGKISVRNSGAIDKINVPAVYKQGKLELAQYLDKYYNRVPWDADKPKRTFRELADIVKFTNSYSVVIKQLAWYLYNTGDDLYNEKYKYLERVIKDDVTIAEVLKEVNGFTNAVFDPTTIPMKITLSQFFHVHNNDAYFYFHRLIQDGSSVKLVPFLLTNKKKEIRLDLIKQKDPQCLLLIENKYILPYPVEVAQMEPEEVSLQAQWVDKWKNDEIPEDMKDPKNLIVEIEEFIKKFIYTQPEIRKVLSLWIYATYYHMLFKSGFPYIMFNGPKGTGKSTFDLVIYLLALNAKMGLDFSSSSMYRMITFEGGTFILDEVEHLNDKRNADNSDYAKILKGGYSDTSYIYRTNMDKGGATEKFSAFGPKVISNINGIDDVIADRCIFIRTFRVPTEKLQGLENINIYKTELRPQVHSITSRCAISAMENFHKVYEIFNESDKHFNTGNARLNQIIKPLFTIAKLVGGDYEKYLISYYEKEIEQTKQEVADSTLEGRVSTVLTRVSNELMGVEPEIWATNPELHLYRDKISFREETKTFEINSLHFKVLVEELAGGEEVDLKLLHATIKSILGPDFDIKTSRINTTITISDELLQRKLGDSKTIRGYRYFINAKDWMDTTKSTLKPSDMTLF